MYVSHLSLRDFRSYEHVDVEFAPGVNALVGPNGQGKTNLVEAIGYLATLKSHRVASDAALVRLDAPRAVVQSRVVRGERASTIELEITAGRANRARINRAPVPRARDVLGLVKTVLFAPEDLVLVKGDPEARRRFLDELSLLLSPRMAGVLGDYERVLRQRGALLKSARGSRRGGSAGPDLRTLDVWDAKLAQLGGQIIAVRQRVIAALDPYVHSAYEQVSLGQGDARITYRSSLAESVGDVGLGPGHGSGLGVGSDDAPGSVAPRMDTPGLLEAQMLEALARLRPRELERGVCLVGPHRDDLTLRLGRLPAKGYASHGESWSFSLALRLASYRLLKDGPRPDTPGLPEDDELAGLWFGGSDSEPVLILDDVFAELDAGRRTRLAELITGASQVLITAAVAGDVPEELAGARFDVMGGSVTRVL